MSTALFHNAVPASLLTLRSFSAPCVNGEGGPILGGWMDAGDWDPRAVHLFGSYRLVQAYLAFPNFFDQLNLNIPETLQASNDLPDLLDEAAWNTDYYASLQYPDGSVSGGIEAGSHPHFGQVSWLNLQPWFCYKPDVYTTLMFAASAAQLARAMKDFDETRADSLLHRAQRAFQWALDNYDDSITFQSPKHQKKYEAQLRDISNLAALELFVATQNDSYHDFFLQETLCIANSPAAGPSVSSLGVWQFDPPYDQVNAAVLYATLNGTVVNSTVQYWCNQYLNELVDAVVEGVNQAAFGASSWIYSTILTKNVSESQLSAVGRSLDFKFGSNPNQISYVSGIGSKQMQHLLIVDRLMDDLPMAPGVTVFGPFDLDGLTLLPDGYENFTAIFTLFIDANLSKPLHPPENSQWPFLEYWIDAYWPAFNEYTPHIGLSESLLHTALYVAAMAEMGKASNLAPTLQPSLAPTMNPTASPSDTSFPTFAPTFAPSAVPTMAPTATTTASTSTSDQSSSTSGSSSGSTTSTSGDADTISESSDFLGLNQSFFGLSKQLTSIAIIAVAGCCCLCVVLTVAIVVSRRRNARRERAGNARRRSSRRSSVKFSSHGGSRRNSTAMKRLSTTNKSSSSPPGPRDSERMPTIASDN